MKTSSFAVTTLTGTLCLGITLGIAPTASAAPTANPCGLTLANAGLNAPATPEALLAADGKAAAPLLSSASAETSIVKTLAIEVAKGAASKVGGELAGWALGALFDANDTAQGGLDPATKAQLDGLTSQMDQVRAELAIMNAQLAKVEGLIKDQTYLNAINTLESNHVAPLMSMWQRQCELVASKNTNKATINALADDILNANSGARAHVTAITQAFKGTPVTGNVALPAMFAEFAKNSGQMPEFDDRVFYSQVLNPFTDHFTALEAMAMTLEVEAWHLKGDTVQAEAAAASYWDGLRATAKAGGYPLTDDKIITHTPSASVWGRDPLSWTATFDSKDAAQHYKDPEDVARQMAQYALLGNKFHEYDFTSGDVVTAFPGGTASFVAPLVATNDLGTLPLTWTWPLKADFEAATAKRGGATAGAYLTANGWRGLGSSNVPTAKISGNNPNDEHNCGRGHFNVVSSTYVGCTGSAASIRVVAHPPTLGSGNYKGVATAPGDAWLDLRWPASPVGQ